MGFLGGAAAAGGVVAAVALVGVGFLGAGRRASLAQVAVVGGLVPMVRAWATTRARASARARTARRSTGFASLSSGSLGRCS